MPPSNRSKALQYHEKGVSHFKKGEFADAVSQFDKAINLGLTTDADYVTYDLKALSLYSYDGVDAEARYAQAYALILKMCDRWGHRSWKPWYRRAHHLNERGLFVYALEAVEKAFALAGPTKRPTIDKMKRDILAAREKSNIKQERRMAKATAEEQAAWAEKKRIEANATKDFTHLLPPDILLLIADQLVAEKPSYACRLAAVCTRWRDVMYHSPAVWHTLELGERRPALKAKRYAERSGGKFHKLKLLPSFRPDQEAKVAEQLKDFVGHLKSLEYRSQPQTLIDELQGRFDSLEALHDVRPSAGELIGMQTGESRRPDAGLILTKPTLKTLVKRGGGCLALGIVTDHGYPDENIVNAWGEVDPANVRRTRHNYLSNVETLDLRDCAVDSSDGLMKLLMEAMPNLRECIMYDCSWQEHSLAPDSATPLQQSDDQKLVFAHLTTWKEAGPLADGTRFQKFSAPNLQHLEISRFPYASEELRNALLAPGLAEALPNLLSLDISRSYHADIDLPDILKQMPSLRFLNISFTDQGDDLLRALTWNDEVTAPATEKRQLLPDLIGLSMAGTTITSIALRDFVLSRLPRTGKTAAAAASKAIASQPARKSAFLPSSSRASASSSKVISSPASGSTLSQGLGATQSARQGGPQASLKWLCIDHVETVDTALSQYLSTKLPFISHSFRDDRNNERIKGQGRFAWDLGHYDSCAEEPKGACTVKLMEGTRDRYEVVHRCGRYDHAVRPEPGIENIWASQWDPYTTQTEPSQAEKTKNPDAGKGWHKMDKEASAQSAGAGPSTNKRPAGEAPGPSSQARVKSRKGKGKISLAADGSLVF